MADHETIELAAVELLASRLCHDLVGPVGAIGNGLELLAEESARFAGETVALVTRSAERTAALLALYRSAVGAAGGQAGFGLADAQPVIANALAGSKIVLDWPEERQAGPLGAAKLVLNLILAAGDMLPRGGAIAVRTSLGGEFAATVTASGAGARLTPELETGFDPEAPAETLTTRSIQAHFTALLCRRKRAALRVTPGSDRVTLSVTMPA